MKFSEQTTTQKGAFGEEICDKYLIKRGWKPYRCILNDEAHPIDRFCASLEKNAVFMLDSKAKARREYYPDTGIDMDCWRTYDRISRQYSMRCFLSFVDERDGEVYGNFLSELERLRWVAIKTKNGGASRLKYPRIENNDNGWIIYFPIVAMLSVGRLSEDERRELQRLSTRNPLYDQQPTFFQMVEQGDPKARQ